MQNSTNRTLFVMVGVTLCLSLTNFASAQRGGGRGGFGGTTSRVRLASIEKVQSELKMTDDQKTLAKEISDKLSEDSRALRGQGGGGGGDRAAMMEKTAKMTAEADAKLVAKLEDAQAKRLTEIFIQVNGSGAIMDKEVSAALKLTEDQQKKLADATEKNREARMEAFQGFRDMSPEERTEATEKLAKESDERVLAVLDDTQREEFAKMKGDEIEIDRTQLRGRGGRGGRGGGGRRQRGNND